GGNEIVLRLNHVRRFDGEKWLAGFHHVTRLGEQFGHAPRVGREHQRRAIFIDGDLALGHMFAAKYDRANRPGREGRPLLRGWVKKSIFTATLSRRLVLAVRVGRTRHRGNDQPCTYDENDHGYGAVARYLRPRPKPGD